MKKITALLLVSILAAVSAHATLFWVDNFQYTNGPIILSSEYTPANGPVGTNSLWVRESGSAASSDMYCVNSNLQVTATGGSLISRQDDLFRMIVQTNWFLANKGLPGGSGNYGIWTNNLGSGANNTPGLIYASFTVICQTSITNYTNTLDSVVNSNTPVINGLGLPGGGPGSYFASFYNTDYGYCGRVQAFTNGTVLPNTWRLGVTDNVLATNQADGGFPVDLAVNTPYQVVEEFDPNNLAAATIWVNPININQTGANNVDPEYTAKDGCGSALTNALNAFAFRQASSFGNSCFVITNLALASTFAEAMTNIWTTNAFPPSVVYQPVGVTNFPGSSFNLSVVANGQGLANLTYQWQKNSVNISNPNGNSNILPFSSVPSNSGTNTYDVVVTTPYGASVTSSATTVAINTTPQPPFFVTQPVSTSVYSGQTVTLSTTVASPGNVTFTWYSNNVVVTSGENDSSYSSSMIINNVTPSNDATYRVAVTNDVFATGIVSTNAVLTVTTPATVNIAYLRTLVDPIAYQATNVPPSIAYQITGTVTTYTNLTSGNTSSYYLQDGTAGINIFVSGGSSFRPAQGDVVTFVGVLSSFTSGLEFYADTADTSFPYTSFTDTGTTNALPAPVILPNNFTNVYGFAYANTNLAGRLVELTNVYFGTNAGTVLSTTANQNLIVTNANGNKATLSFFDLDLDTAGKTLPTNAISVTGVMYGEQPTFSVAITRFADIVTNPAVLIPTQSAHVTGFSLVNMKAVISGTNGQSGGTYYLLSSTNVALPLSQWVVVATNVVNTNGANGAFTFTGTNVITPGDTNQFYILSSTNSNHQ